MIFCHDFQNSHCQRINCRFLHYPLHEVEHYNKFGHFSIVPRKEKQLRKKAVDIDFFSIVRKLEQEQIILKRRVETNEIKISELQAKNDFLMAQNSHLQQQNQQNQQNKINSQSIIPPTTTGTPIVSISASPALALAQPISISNASQSIISYPVVTHSILPH